MNHIRRKSTLILVVALLLIVCLIVGQIYRGWRQARLNQALMNALEYRAAQDLPALLHQGADPNARVPTKTSLTWQDILQRFIRGFPLEKTTDTALMKPVFHL